jgi:hypothetical protein
VALLLIMFVHKSCNIPICLPLRQMGQWVFTAIWVCSCKHRLRMGTNKLGPSSVRPCCRWRRHRCGCFQSERFHGGSIPLKSGGEKKGPKTKQDAIALSATRTVHAQRPGGRSLVTGQGSRNHSAAGARARVSVWVDIACVQNLN